MQTKHHFNWFHRVIHLGLIVGDVHKLHNWFYLKAWHSGHRYALNLY